MHVATREAEDGEGGGGRRRRAGCRSRREALSAEANDGGARGAGRRSGYCPCELPVATGHTALGSTSRLANGRPRGDTPEWRDTPTCLSRDTPECRDTPEWVWVSRDGSPSAAMQAAAKEYASSSQGVGGLALASAPIPALTPPDHHPPTPPHPTHPCLANDQGHWRGRDHTFPQSHFSHKARFRRRAVHFCRWASMRRAKAFDGHRPVLPPK